MKGIILAGGSNMQFDPATKAISKQLIPVQDDSMIKRLNWDSDFFGYSIGRLDYYKSSISLHNIQNLKHYELVYLFAYNKIERGKTLPEPFTKIIFSNEINGTYTDIFENYPNISELNLKNITKEEREQLIHLGYQSGIYSRFKLDINFSEKEFRNLYRKWVTNSINQKIADQIIVSRDSRNHITGFITISHAEAEDSTKIGLFAVSSNCRGKGIGSKLISASKYLAQRNNSKILKVATQSQNKKACDFYLKNGFTKNKSIDIYHLWQI